MRIAACLLAVALGACTSASTAPDDLTEDGGAGGGSDAGGNDAGAGASSSGSPLGTGPWTGGGGLRVELIWDRGPTDLDVHLVKEVDGEFPLGSAADCYAMTCLPGSPGPRWDPASPRHAGGNPTMEHDSITTGPEAVSVSAPVAGRYLVAVHAADDGRAFAVTPRITVRLAGNALPEVAAPLEPGATWSAGIITWDASGEAYWLTPASP